MMFKLILCFALFLFNFDLIAKPMKIVFINPGFSTENSTGKFWFKVNTIMESAADDLSINLITFYANRDHIYMKSLVNKAIEAQPDYLILVNEKGTGPAMLNKLEGHNIPVFFLLNTLSPQELTTLTKPQVNNLIGYLKPDNFQAGYKLAIHLIELGKKRLLNIPLYLLALQGDYVTSAAISRKQGLFKALEEYQNDVTLIDSTVSNWSQNLSYVKTKGILKHENNINLIWSANDAIAFGANAAINDLAINHPVIIGGINWDIDTEGNKTDVSYGGHVLLGAKALVMLYDHANKQLKTDEMKLTLDIFQPNTTLDSQEIIALISQNKTGKINFKHFTKAHITPQKFTIKNVIKSAKDHLN